MAERSLTLTLDVATLARAEDAAAASGLSVEVWAAEVLNAALTPGVGQGVQESPVPFEGPHDWTEANRRLAEYDRTGESVPLEEALREFRRHVESGLASKT